VAQPRPTACDKLAKLEGCPGSPGRPPPPGVQQAVEFICNHMLQRRMLERQVSIHPFEPAVLMVGFFQPRDVGRLQPAILGFPLTPLRWY